MAGHLPPTEQMPYPTKVEEERRTLGYTDTEELARNKAASGGLDDDPTESGMPVENRKSFKITRDR